MLATQHKPHTTQFQPHAFTPNKPSPLSPRRSQDYISHSQQTTHVPRYLQSMNTADHQQQQQQQQPRPSTPRSVDRKYRPELHGTTRGALAQKRRAIFRAKIQTQREDKTWARRGEELERLDDRNEWARWEQEALRLAPEIDVDVDALDEGEGETEEADEVARIEERELAALVEMMDAEMTVDAHVDLDEHFGSDEEDYESLFAGLECDASRQAGPQYVEQRQGGVMEQSSETEHEAEGMDLS